MQIVIYDTDVESCKMMQDFIEKYELKNDIRVDIDIFHNREELLAYKRKFDILFIHKEENTTEQDIIRRLRSQGNSFITVFIIDDAQAACEVLGVFPYCYLLAPVSESDIVRILDAILWEKDALSTIMIIDDGDIKVIPSREVLYLEADGKYCIIRTRQETFRSSKTLAEAFVGLPKHCFFRTHKSYAVNMQYVAYIDNNYVTFTNGEKALISKNKVNEFVEEYNHFINNLYLAPHLYV